MMEFFRGLEQKTMESVSKNFSKGTTLGTLSLEFELFLNLMDILSEFNEYILQTTNINQYLDYSSRRHFNTWNWQNLTIDKLVVACQAIGYGCLEIVQIMVEHGEINSDLNTLLHSVCYTGDLKAVRFLVEQGADDLERALLIARANRQSEVVEYLTPLVSHSC